MIGRMSELILKVTYIDAFYVLMHGAYNVLTGGITLMIKEFSLKKI